MKMGQEDGTALSQLMRMFKKFSKFENARLFSVSATSD